MDYKGSVYFVSWERIVIDVAYFLILLIIQISWYASMLKLHPSFWSAFIIRTYETLYKKLVLQIQMSGYKNIVDHINVHWIIHFEGSLNKYNVTIPIFSASRRYHEHVWYWLVIIKVSCTKNARLRWINVKCAWISWY